jgi:hypothetical protein
MLHQAEAALLTGAPRDHSPAETGLDLAEAWTELSGLPYVHGVLCTRRTDLSSVELEVLTGLGATVGGSDHDSPRGFTYEFSDETADALQEYLRYAHFHGLLPDIPALNFYGE